MTPHTQQCSRCRRTLAVTEFHRNRRRPNGRQAYCKRCSTEARGEWFERLLRKHVEQGREQGRAEAAGAH